jgi:hypothetical protein
VWSLLSRLAQLTRGPRILFWLMLAGLVTVFGPLPVEAVLRQPKILLLLCSFAWLSLKTLGQYRFRVGTPSVADALEEMERTRESYVLLLRPFGADGAIQMGTGSSWMDWGIPWRETTTLEVVLGKTVEKAFGVPTIAVVSPGQLVLPPGPRYVRVTEDWQRDVDRLLRRAAFVVVVLPPSKGCTPAVRWEIERCVQLGLVGRLLLVAPPDPDGDGLGASLQALCDLLPELAGAAWDTLCAFPRLAGPPKLWPLRRNAKGQPLVPDRERYQSILRNAFEDARELGASGSAK